jgi:hypothetical protein
LGANRRSWASSQRREEKRVTRTTEPYLNTLPGYFEEKREYVTKETGSCALRLKDGERIEFDSMIGDHFGLSWAIEHQRTQFQGTPPRAHRKQKKATNANDAIREAQSIEPLLVALRDVESGVRVQAVQDLGTLGGAQAIDPLLTALHDPASAVREAAANAFIGIGDGREIEPLLAALQDPVSTVRRQVAETLGSIGEQQAVESLVVALGDPDSTVREAAREALSRLQSTR